MGRGKRYKGRFAEPLPFHEISQERERYSAEPELARCCPAPSFARENPARPPYRQRCRTCGTWHYRQRSLPFARSLEQRPHSRCPHEEVELLDFLAYEKMGSVFKCKSCHLCWRGQKPEPHEDGQALDVFHKEWTDEWMEQTGLAELAREGARKKVVAEALEKPRSRPSGLASRSSAS